MLFQLILYDNHNKLVSASFVNHEVNRQKRKKKKKKKKKPHFRS